MDILGYPMLSIFTIIVNMATKKLVWVIVVLVVLGLLVTGYLYFSKPAKEGAIGTTEKVSQSVPTITTNAADKLPEVNPLDRANPFKYTNPLR